MEQEVSALKLPKPTRTAPPGDTAGASFLLRPQRDLNPCYRRERPAKYSQLFAFVRSGSAHESTADVVCPDGAQQSWLSKTADSALASYLKTLADLLAELFAAGAEVAS